ncbi:hypothetical protein G7054_g13692 [Neopestalotiopsis clavispora]|nr:hypothetical protein G7054_g13692 [Neopestalotiopsis clavispora]
MHNGYHPTGFLDKRSRRAWNGFLGIIGIIFVTLLVMGGAMIHEVIEFQQKTPEDIANQGQDNTGMIYKRDGAAVDKAHPNIVTTLVPTLLTIDSTPGHETNTMEAMIETIVTIVTQTVYNTESHTATNPTAKSAMFPTSGTHSSVTHTANGPSSEASTATTTGPIPSDAVVETGLGWCRDDQRRNDVYTPCSYVYTEPPPSPPNNDQARTSNNSAAAGPAIQSNQPVTSSAAGRNRPLSLLTLAQDFLRWHADNWRWAHEHCGGRRTEDASSFHRALQDSIHRRLHRHLQKQKAEAGTQHCIVAALDMLTRTAVANCKLLAGDDECGYPSSSPSSTTSVGHGCGDARLVSEIASLQEQIAELKRQLAVYEINFVECQNASCDQCVEAFGLVPICFPVF